jgi:hypothetical protein
MDLLQRCLAWLVRITLHRTTFADRLDRFRGISNARSRLDCGDRARCEVHFARRCDQASTLDDSQLCPHRRYHSAHVPEDMTRIAILERAAVVRRGRRLEYFTIAWNTLKSLVAVVAGAIAASRSWVLESIASSK